MSATLFSSVLMFIATGVYVVFFGHRVGWTSYLPSDLRGTLVLWTLLLFAAHSYYWAALCELHENTRVALQTKCSRFEWFIRLFNQASVLLIWVVLTLRDSYWFECFLPALYLSFLLWDAVTWQALSSKEKRLLTLLDFLGFLGVSGLVYLIHERDWTYLGYANGAYIVLTALGLAAGVVLLEFNPFSRALWSRQRLH